MQKPVSSVCMVAPILSFAVIVGGAGRQTPFQSYAAANFFFFLMSLLPLRLIRAGTLMDGAKRPVKTVGA